MLIKDVHTHNINSENSVFNLDYFDANIDSKIYSVGFHPWQIEKYNNFSIESLMFKADNKNCLAIGECGIDKNFPKHDIQFEILTKHIDVAYKLNKPLIIHSVKSYNEIIKLKKNNSNSIKWLIHGFNSKLNILLSLINIDIDVSISVSLLNNKEKLNSYLKVIPLKNIYLETDDSDIEINELVEYCAKYYGFNLHDFESIILENTKHLFKL